MCENPGCPQHRGDAVIFRQLLDPETSTYTYLLADEESREAVLIDGVLEQLERDVALLRELELELTHTLETHVHADHVTSSGHLREQLGSRVAVAAAGGVANADVELRDGDVVTFGGYALEVLSTPGHTDGCVTYHCREAGMAFTGDALLIRGCGRTDFQQGDAAMLFRSVRERIFALSAETLLYPGHDYQGRTVTTVAEEKRWNPRLAHPKRIDVAVPANLRSGLVAPQETAEPAGERRPVADLMEEQGRQDAEPWLGMGI